MFGFRNPHDDFVLQNLTEQLVMLNKLSIDK